MSRELELELTEYIRILENRHKAEIEAEKRDRNILKEQVNILKYALKGACQEHLNIKYCISPEMLTQSIRDRDLIDLVVKQTTNMMSHHIEEKLGNRYKLEQDYSKALQYIRYLQNHAAAKGVIFSPFEHRIC